MKTHFLPLHLFIFLEGWPAELPIISINRFRGGGGVRFLPSFVSMGEKYIDGRGSTGHTNQLESLGSFFCV